MEVRGQGREGRSVAAGVVAAGIVDAEGEAGGEAGAAEVQEATLPPQLLPLIPNPIRLFHEDALPSVDNA